MKKRIPREIIVWLSKDIPRGKATFSDLMNSIQYQLICCGLAYSPFKMLTQPMRPYELFRWALPPLLCLAAFVTTGMCLLALTHTTIVVDQLVFFARKSPPKQNRARRLAYVGVVLCIVYTALFASFLELMRFNFA